MNCPCGKPLHYTDPEIKKVMVDLVCRQGETVAVTVAGRTWSVSRHYIALHGLKASELSRLGFVELVIPRSGGRR